MRTVWHIASREVRSYFTSPIAYVILGAFMSTIGFMFWNILNWYNTQEKNILNQMSFNDVIIRPLWGNMNIMLLFIVPAITMRLLAEEERLQTLVLLITAPIRIGELVLGKFLGGALFAMAMIAATVVFPAVMIGTGNPPLAPMGFAYIGVVLVVCCYMALGLFFSSLTESQILAYVLGVLANLLLWLISWVSSTSNTEWVQELCDYLSVIPHFNSFASGVVNSSDLVYFVSFIGFWLFATYLSMESKRWR